MAEPVSDKLRDALERLDQAIDQLESKAASNAKSVLANRKASNDAVVQRLDKVIGRIEAALSH